MLCSKSPKWSCFATAIFSSNDAPRHPTRSSSGLEQCFTSLLGLWKAPTILLERLSVGYDPHQNGLDLCYTWSWGKGTEPASICGEMRCPQLWGAGGGGLSPEGLWLCNPLITSNFIQLIRIQCGHFQ